MMAYLEKVIVRRDDSPAYNFLHYCCIAEALGLNISYTLCYKKLLEDPAGNMKDLC